MDRLEAIRKSARLNWEVFLHGRHVLCEGVSEKEVAQALEEHAKKLGATAMAFEPIVAFQENTAIPHHKPTGRKLKKGDAVTIDVGIVVDDYASDLTRSFGGNPVLEMLVKEAFQIALKMCKPGADFANIQEAVDSFFKEKGVFHLRKHTLGHGVGRQVHEAPFVWSEDRIFHEGLVVTIEPGLYEDGKGGYRHEDTIIITKEGYESLYCE